jgi:glutamate dehydrogenase/leucine dehydrogenase
MIMDKSGDDPNINRLGRIQSPFMTGQHILRLYEHMLRHSELSPDSIIHQIESAMALIDTGRYFFLSRDIEELHLSIEEISFLLEHNRYQEKESADTTGGYQNIDVRGTFSGKHLFFISDTTELVRKITESIEDIIRDGRNLLFRLYSYVFTNNPGTRDVRRLYILEHEAPGCLDPPVGDEAARFVRDVVQDRVPPVPDEAVREFLRSSSSGFIARGLYNRKKKNIENYLFAWMKVRRLIQRGEDIHIEIEAANPEESPREKLVLLWLPREKFQENFRTINNIFERRGISFTRQYFETFFFGDTAYIAVITSIDAEFLTTDEEEFLKSELYNRLVLLKSTPLSVGEIRDVLDRIKGGRDYEKLDLIDVMQKNKQKEYLVPLVFLLSDSNDEIRNKSFGLIKHYLLNPTEEMKDNYYWSTLKNIVTAATVPLQREPDRSTRSLTDTEIISLIKFRDIFYEDYRDPLSGRVYLFIRINGCGIGKGGIRADVEHVSFSGEGALSTNMLFKTLGLGIPLYTTAKGGILGDLRLESVPIEERDRIRSNVLTAYADFLYYKACVGPLSDVPAGDVGIGSEEIGIIFKRITDNACRDLERMRQMEITCASPEARILLEHFGINTESAEAVCFLADNRDVLERYTAPTITGKSGSLGLTLRNGATGRGLLEVLASQQNYNDYNNPTLWSDPGLLTQALAQGEDFNRRAHARIRMLTFSIQGFGKVGAAFAHMLDGIGAKIKMISDISGTLVNERGIPGISKLAEFCKTGSFRLADVPSGLHGNSEFIPGDTVRPLTAVVNIVVPSALEDVIINRDKSGACKVSTRDIRGEYILQGANGPVTANAEDRLSEMGIVSFPDILANAGGVLASYMEWLNGLIRVFGYGRLYREGFVHPIVHNLTVHYYPDAVIENITMINEKVFEYAFNFILRWATSETIGLSRTYKISLRTAYMALGISNAAHEGRLSGQFDIRIENMRDTFALRK